VGDTAPLADREVIDVAALDVAGLAAAEGQVDELAVAEEEVGADWKTAALEFKAIIEKLLRVVEFGQAQNIAAAENFIGQLQGGNAKAAAAGDPDARQRALELESAFGVLSSFDEGPDLVLYFKHMMVLKGDKEYTLHFNDTDALSESQRGYVEAQLKLFDTWYVDWSKLPGAVEKYKV